jgi:hypothetical protein
VAVLDGQTDVTATLANGLGMSLQDVGEYTSPWVLSSGTSNTWINNIVTVYMLGSGSRSWNIVATADKGGYLTSVSTPSDHLASPLKMIADSGETVSLDTGGQVATGATTQIGGPTTKKLDLIQQVGSFETAHADYHLVITYTLTPVS